ncbi:hypothetical protein SAMN04515647_4753 [Cohaesibacter sp. ES.047]|nr:hypothetical protein SAMN04515647_4753 [Cohaesibacter sp. ES.047]
MGWGPERDFSGSPFRSIEEAIEHNGSDKFLGTEKSDVIAHDSFVKELIKVLPSDEIAALKKDLAVSSSGRPLEVSSDVYDCYEEFRKKFSGLPEAKSSKVDNFPVSISGAPQHFFVKDGIDSATTRYHEQITHLRRENDYLKKQLNITLTPSSLHRWISRVLSPRLVLFLRYRFPRLTSFYVRYFMRKQAK